VKLIADGKQEDMLIAPEPRLLVASAVFRDTQHHYEYLTGELASLPGMRSVETAPVIRTLKRTGSVL